MKVLLDINVLLDVVLQRQPWDEPAARLLAAVERGRLEAFVAGHTLPTIHYVVTRARGKDVAAGAIADLLGLVDVVAVEKDDFHRALAMPIDDFEDAVQIAAALGAGADYIVTRNERDFRQDSIAVVRPESLLAML